MNAIKIAWNKHSSNQVQCITNNEDFPQDSRRKRKNQKPKKKVRFNCSSPIEDKQELEEIDEQYGIQSTDDVFDSQPLADKTEPLCSLRAAVIIFVILTASAIAMGCAFILTKTSNNNTTSNFDQSGFSFPAVLTTPIISSIIIGNQSGPPCSSYTTINDPSRNVNQNTAFGPCDNGPIFNSSNGGAWIRFVGSGGELLASSEPQLNHCGAYMQVWFNETLPTTIGTITNGKVLLIYKKSVNLLNWDVSVLYCTGNFYIYYLRPLTICYARYCTE